MNSNTILGIIGIILGIIIIACPLAGFLTASWVIAFSIIFMGIYALIAGFSGETDAINIILGIIFIIFGVIMFAYPAILSFLAAFFNYFIGIVLIVFSIVNLFSKGDGKWACVLGIILGIIALIFGCLALNPIFLGVVIGIWFIVAGVNRCVIPDNIDF